MLDQPDRPVTAIVPLIAGEIGENDCAHTYIDPLMSWLNSKSASYLAWAWNTDFNCTSGPGLITSYTGTPTAYGAGYESELRMLAPGSTRSHRLPYPCRGRGRPWYQLRPRQPCDGVTRGRGLRSRMVIPHRVTRDNASRTIALVILLVP